ncbi:ATP-binding protein [Roseateles albus]|uniref:Winged helix-turn-helix domain-containing protein n=1 Tax=Roseateles albus TaxID=2987525 RepID=A0ABT5KEV6_9BURK|nr:winged helix-turn-helix domain-containing protein [Roseateles albus]MDC8771917.1 winged helix-turn-helix domain-containing protein [Roseateles albus]
MHAQEPSPQRLNFGPFEIDLHAQRLLREQQPVALRPRYFDVLVFLAKSGGKLVTKDELLDAVWGHRHVSDSVLKVAINALRVALDEDAKAPRHLETVSRRGYRLMGVNDARPTAGGQAAKVAAPAPASNPSPSLGNLPAPQAGLIGRDAELTQLQDMFASQRLITLHGPAGVGKTRLALSAAQHAAPADGVWLIRLDALADAEPLLATVARTLNLGASTQTSADTLARALAPLSMRLLLDNAEHLVQAVAELATALLNHAPRLQLLVTSQLPLRVSGETVVAVAPLAVPSDASEGLDNSDAAAVQLLRQRAQQHDAALPWTPAAAASAGAIARMLDGLPLALELAAARVPLLGWAGVHARLDERFALLTRGERGAPERHRTLRAALAWSCALLQPTELRLLQRLSVIAGSFSLDAAAAVLGTPVDADLLDALDGLREHALLSSSESGNAPRWRLYDSVRSYAAEGLQASDEETAAMSAMSGLVNHLIALFERADLELFETFLRPWLAQLKLEDDSLRAALQAALQQPALQLQGVALFSASANYRARAGHKRELQQDHALVSALPRDHWPARLQARFDLAQSHLGVMAQVISPALALDSARRAQQAFRELGEVPALYVALDRETGCLMRQQAPLEQRVDAIARMRALEPEAWGPRQRRFRAWHDLMLLRDMGNDSLYEDRITSYLASSRAQGDDYGAWNSAQLLAQLKSSQGDLAAATQLLDLAVTEMRSTGQLLQNKPVLAQWAFLRIAQDAEPATVQLLREAVAALQAEAMLWWMADALAWLPAHQGRWHDALRLQTWADGLVAQRGDKRGPMFKALRERMQAQFQTHAAGLLGAALQEASGLDETAAMALCFGPTELSVIQ